jgi:hypothetical protein
MAQPIPDHWQGETESATTGVGDPTTRRLAPIIAALVCGADRRCLPDWTYATWCRALEYPELRPRAHATTKELGHRRDEVLSHSAVRSLVEWAGSRKRDNPVAGAAAALVAVRSADAGAGGGPLDLSELTHLVAVAVDSAQTVRSSSTYRRHLRLLAEPDRLPAVAQDAAVAENPRLSEAVGTLLHLAGADSGSQFAATVEGAVVQAGDWWTRHSAPVPASIEGPCLPGLLLARRLRPAERLSAHVSDSRLLRLVAGPHPGRGRPCQIAWRRGLTFWVAVHLSSPDGSCRPPAETVRWWRTQLDALASG